MREQETGFQGYLVKSKQNKKLISKCFGQAKTVSLLFFFLFFLTEMKRIILFFTADLAKAV